MIAGNLPGGDTLQRLWHEHTAALIAGIVLLVMLWSSVVVVPETEQAVVMFLGDPVRVINRFHPHVDYGDTGAGLSLRVPFFEHLVWVDKRMLSVEMDRQQVVSSDQQRLEVDAYARFRVIDPVRMVRTAGTTDRLIEQLQPILNSELRQGLARHTFQSLLTAERSAVMAQIRIGLDKQARAYGAQVIDVRIKRADLPSGGAARQRLRADAGGARAGGDGDPRQWSAQCPDHAGQSRGGGVADLCRELWQGPGVLRFLPRHAELWDDV